LENFSEIGKAYKMAPPNSIHPYISPQTKTPQKRGKKKKERKIP